MRNLTRNALTAEVNLGAAPATIPIGQNACTLQLRANYRRLGSRGLRHGSSESSAGAVKFLGVMGHYRQLSQVPVGERVYEQERWPVDKGMRID